MDEISPQIGIINKYSKSHNKNKNSYISPPIGACSHRNFVYIQNRNMLKISQIVKIP